MFQQLYGITVKVKDDASKSLKGITEQSKRTASSLAGLQGKLDKNGRLRDVRGRFIGTGASAGGGGQMRSVTAKAAPSGGDGGGIGMAAMGGGGYAVAATAIAAGVALVGKEVITTTSNFEKMEAVLATTLSSNSAAKQAFSQINKFAADTPFQVDELTDAFVKLSSNGFVPAQAEMRSLGDLAAAKGKSFDQLAEALLDAETGEFERLKEFGIKASKEGNKVSFVFKNQKKVVDANAESIRAYILGLGNAAGVSGTMAKVSATMGGQISNLQDNITGVAYDLGKEFRPAIMHGIKSISDIASATRVWISENHALLSNMSNSAISIMEFGKNVLGAVVNVKHCTQATNALVSVFGGLAMVGGDIADWASKSEGSFDKMTSATDRLYESLGRITSRDVRDGIRGFFDVLTSTDSEYQKNKLPNETRDEYNKRIGNKYHEGTKAATSLKRGNDINAAKKELADAYGVSTFDELMGKNAAGKPVKLKGLGYTEQLKALGYDYNKNKEDVVDFLQKQAGEAAMQRVYAKGSAGVGASAGGKGSAGSELSPVGGDKKQIQHITINISKLTGIENVVTNNIREGIAKMGDMVSEQLLKTITDTQIIAGQ